MVVIAVYMLLQQWLLIKAFSIPWYLFFIESVSLNVTKVKMKQTELNGI